MAFIIRTLVSTIAVAAAIFIVPGIEPMGGLWSSALIFALILGFVNAFIKPVLSLLSAPINLLTLGLFSFILNAFILMIAGWFATSVFHNGIAVHGFFAALLGSIVISFVNALVSKLVGSES